MHCHTEPKVSTKDKSGAAYDAVALIGNPNVGKSVLFGLLTGRYATVSNYPGTTVEVTRGNVTIAGRKIHIIDTPGVNSLIPMSEDEQVTRDILLKECINRVVHVGDAKNLKRTLFITIQLSEMGVPVVLDMNMLDEAGERGIIIDVDALAKRLATEVVSTVAPERRGLSELRESIVSKDVFVPALRVFYPDQIERAVSEIEGLLPDANISKRSLALMMLAGDETLREWIAGNVFGESVLKIEGIKSRCTQELGREISTAINESRMKLAGEIASDVSMREAAPSGTIAAAIGRMSMHPVWGVFALLIVMFAMYEFVGVLGADILVGLLEEKLFGEYLNPMFTTVIEALIPFKIVQESLVGQYGIITMALTYAIGIILPITGTFFIAFSILEDSGYLPRLAIMSNRIFNLMGLSGKAVLPMVLGLGCGTMAVMTTRILETWRDRMIATFLLALAVPCAAQLGVIMGLIGGLSGTAWVIWIGTIVVVLFIGGWLASMIIPGERSDFFLEIPPIRMPALKNIAIKTTHRVVWYLKEAVPLFIYGTLALFVLNKIHALSVLQDLASPVIVRFLGLPEQATEAFLIGFFRRDYGAAGLYKMAENGLLTPSQILVSIITLTLFVPCLAHFLMMIKERGARSALTMVAVILAVAIGAGGLVNYLLKTFGIEI